MLKKDKSLIKSFLINHKIVILILVRLNSKRLPQKAKLKLNKFSIIEILIKRLLKSLPNEQIYLCTSSKEKNEYLKKISKDYKINFHKGSDQNIFNRIKTLKKKKFFNHFVRVTGDNPFTDVSAIHKMIKKHIKFKSDYTYTNDLPIGTRPEIISFKALNKASKLAVKPNSSEYMTYFFKRDIFKILKVYFKKSFNNQNLLNISIDTIQQFIRIKKLFKNEKLSISRERIIKLCKKNSKFYEKEILKHIPLQTKKYDVRFKKNVSKKILL